MDGKFTIFSQFRSKFVVWVKISILSKILIFRATFLFLVKISIMGQN